MAVRHVQAADVIVPKLYESTEEGRKVMHILITFILDYRAWGDVYFIYIIYNQTYV